MKIYCFGSINIDHVYHVPHIPSPGETLSASSVKTNLGGKGANTSIALASAGADVCHIGAISDVRSDDWIMDALSKAGVATQHIERRDGPTGHAIVQVAEDGENAITILSGANGCTNMELIARALENAQSGGWFVLQNETNNCAAAAKLAKQKGLKVGYVAAPFDVKAVLEILDDTDLIAMNEHEAQALEQALGRSIEDANLPDTLITLGSKGAKFLSSSHNEITQPAFAVEKVIDTTCAGDTYFGYFMHHLSQGDSIADAMRMASAAASLTIQKAGASASIPSRRDVEALLKVD